jgi:hypothetical protein
LKQPEGQWLPPTLFGMGVAESQKMRGMGGAFFLVKSGGGVPVILFTGGDGGRMVGRFEVNEAGVATGTGKRRAASTTRAAEAGEMLR